MKSNSQKPGNTQCHRRRSDSKRSTTSPTISAFQQAANVAASLGFQNCQQQQQSMEKICVYQEPLVPPIMDSQADADVEMFQRMDVEDEHTVPSGFSGQVGQLIHEEHYKQQEQRAPGFSVSRIVQSPSISASKTLQAAPTPSNFFDHPFRTNLSVPSVISNNIGVWTGCSSEEPALFDYQGLSRGITAVDHRAHANDHPHPLSQSALRLCQQQQKGGADPSIAWLTASKSLEPHFGQPAYGFNRDHPLPPFDKRGRLCQPSTGPTSFSPSVNNNNNHSGYDLGNHPSLLLTSSFPSVSVPAMPSTSTSEFGEPSFHASMTRILTPTLSRPSLAPIPTRYSYRCPSSSLFPTPEIPFYQQPPQPMNVDTYSPFSYFSQPSNYNIADDDDTTTSTTDDDHNYSEYKAALLQRVEQKSYRIPQEAAQSGQQQHHLHAIQQQLNSRRHRRHRRHYSLSSSATETEREVDDITSNEDRCLRSALARPSLRTPRRSPSSLNQYISRKVRGATRRAARRLRDPKYMAAKAVRRHRLSNESDMDEGRTYQMPKHSTLAARLPPPSPSISLRDVHEYVAWVAALAVNKIPHSNEEARKFYDLQRMASVLLRERHESFFARLDEEAADDSSVPFAADQEGHNTVFGSGLTPAEWLDAQRWIFSPTEDPITVFTMHIHNEPSGGDEEGGDVPVTTSNSTSGVVVATLSEEPTTIASTSTAAQTTTSSISTTAVTTTPAAMTTTPSSITTTRPLKKDIVVPPKNQRQTRSQTRQIQFKEIQSTQYFSADEEVTQISTATTASSGSQHKVCSPPLVQGLLTTKDSHTFGKVIKTHEKKAKAEREEQQAAVREARAAAVSDVIQGEDYQVLADEIQKQEERDRERRDKKSDLMEERSNPVEEKQARKWIKEQLERRRWQSEAERGRSSWPDANLSDQGEGSPSSVLAESTSTASVSISVRVPVLTRTTSYAAGRYTTSNSDIPSVFESATATTTAKTQTSSNSAPVSLSPPPTQSIYQDPSLASLSEKSKETQELEDFNRWADQNEAYYGNNTPHSRGRSPTVRHTLSNRPRSSSTRRSRSPSRRSRSPANHRSSTPPSPSQPPAVHHPSTPPNNPTSLQEEPLPPCKRKRVDTKKYKENEDEQRQQKQKHKEGEEQQQDENDDDAGEGSSYGRRRKTRRELQIERDEALASEFQAAEVPNRLSAQIEIDEDTALKLQRSEEQRVARAGRAAARERRRGDYFEVERQQQQFLNDDAVVGQLQRGEDDSARQRNSGTASILPPLPCSSASAARPISTYYSSASAGQQHQQEYTQPVASLSFSSLTSTRSLPSSSLTMVMTAIRQLSTPPAEPAVTPSPPPPLSLPPSALTLTQPYSQAIPVSIMLSNSSGSTSPPHRLTTSSSSSSNQSLNATFTSRPAQLPPHPYGHYSGRRSSVTGSGAEVSPTPSSVPRYGRSSASQYRSRSQSSSSSTAYHTSPQPRRRYRSNLDMLADVASAGSSSKSSSLSPAPPSAPSRGGRPVYKQGSWRHSATGFRGLAGETIIMISRSSQTSGDDLTDDDQSASQSQVGPSVAVDSYSAGGSRNRSTPPPPYVIRRSRRIQGRNTTASVLDFLSEQDDKEDREKVGEVEIKEEEKEVVVVKEDKKAEEKARMKQEREKKKVVSERKKEDERQRKKLEKEMKKAEKEAKKKEEKERKEEEKARKRAEKAEETKKKKEEKKEKKEEKLKLAKPKVVKETPKKDANKMEMKDAKGKGKKGEN